MNKLSIVDNGFLMAETRETPLHVAALQIFKLPEGVEGVDKQDFFAETLTTMGKLTATTPLFNQRLRNSALSPSWIPDDDYDLDYHMRHSSLPRPGSRDQLMTLVGRLHGLLLDRTRPLWELHLIDGIENDQFAIYFKIHHSLIDGVGGMKLMQNMLSKSPAAHTARPLGEKEAKGEKAAKRKKTQQAESSARETLASTFKLLSTLAPEMGKELLGYGRQRINPDPEAARQWYEAPDSPINVPISAQRRFAVNSFKLEDFKRVSKAKKVTINDIVITICGGALRRYMLEQGNLPETSLNAGVPVSVRAKGQNAGNAFSMMMCDMGTHIADSTARLKFVHDATKKSKSHLGSLSREAIMGLTIVMGVPLMGSQMLGIAKNAPLPYNVLVSNVPGSKNKLYLNGAEMVGFYPVNLLYDMQALSITVTSYVDSLDFGLIACRKTIPELNKLTSYLTSEFEKLT
jgi:diacylglycerol O-acyltransferase